jgi:hypothetical protein
MKLEGSLGNVPQKLRKLLRVPFILMKKLGVRGGGDKEIGKNLAVR